MVLLAFIKNFWKTTRYHEGFWRNRKADWKTSYFDTWDHPHRKEIITHLRTMKFGSLFEVGCSSGPNLYLISKCFPQVQIGGLDVNEEAIQTAKNLLGDQAVMLAGKADDILLSDGSADVVLTDACLIYVGPKRIHNTLKELKRVARKNVIFIEWHSPSWRNRWIMRLLDGYNVYDYKKLLEQHGFWDIEIKKLPPYWGDQKGNAWGMFGTMITAKV